MTTAPRQAKKKDAILSAAVEIFSEKGFHNTKIEEIADLAKIGKGTIYEYFSSKEALFESSIRGCVEYLDGIIKREVLSKDTAKERLESFIRENINILLRFKNLAKLMSLDLMNPEKLKAFTNKELFKERLALVIEIIRRGKEQGEFQQVNPYLAAAMIHSYLIGVTHVMICFPEFMELEDLEVTDEVVRLVMEGLSSIRVAE